MELQPPVSVDVSCSSAQPAGERRNVPDRRQEPTSPWGAFFLTGRRRRNRRADDQRQPYFADRFSAMAFLGVLALVAASLLDAIFTMQLLFAGGREINPLMDCLLVYGIGPFVFGKYVLTVGGLPLLLIFKNHYLFGTRFRVGYLIPTAVALYAILIAYQLVLIYGHAAV